MILKNTSQLFYLTCIGSVISSAALAQDTTSNTQQTRVKSLNKAKIYFVGIGFEREQRISKQSTLYFGAAVEGVVPFLPSQGPNGSDALSGDCCINIAPVISVGYKNYYNLSRRSKLDKPTKNNTASFVGFEYNLIAPVLINNRFSTNYVSSFSPVWGFQKNVKYKWINFNLELIAGPSFQTDFHHRRASGFVRFGYSFLL